MNVFSAGKKGKKKIEKRCHAGIELKHMYVHVKGTKLAYCTTVSEGVVRIIAISQERKSF